MKGRLPKLLSDRSELGVSTRKLTEAAQLAELHRFRLELLELPRYSDEKRLLKSGYRVYSQSDEDGILHEIFRRIGTKTRLFVEIGSGDGFENNSVFLLMQGWQGVWVEAAARKVATAEKSTGNFIKSSALRIEQRTVNAENIDELMARMVPDREVDLLSVDIDGNDFYILEAIRSISPRVVICEYNAKFPPHVPWVMEYNQNHNWDGTDYFGASLKALEKLLAAKGYSLVGCNLLGCNAFFVRNDLVADGAFCSPYTAENHYEPARYFLLPAYHSGFPPGFGPFRLVD
jgi:hypothetical protein